MIKRVFVIFNIFLVVLILIYSVSVGGKLRNIESIRDNRLIYYELQKERVIRDVVTYLTLKNEDYLLKRDLINMTSDLKNRLIPEKYQKYVLPEFDSIKVIDAQYTVDSSDKIIYYIGINATKGDKVSKIELMVFQKSGLIYDIKVI